MHPHLPPPPNNTLPLTFTLFTNPPPLLKNKK